MSTNRIWACVHNCNLEDVRTSRRWGSKRHRSIQAMSSSFAIMAGAFRSQIFPDFSRNAFRIGEKCDSDVSRMFGDLEKAYVVKFTIESGERVMGKIQRIFFEGSWKKDVRDRINYDTHR